MDSGEEEMPKLEEDEEGIPDIVKSSPPVSRPTIGSVRPGYALASETSHVTGTRHF